MSKPRLCMTDEELTAYNEEKARKAYEKDWWKFYNKHGESPDSYMSRDENGNKEEDEE